MEKLSKIRARPLECFFQFGYRFDDPSIKMHKRKYLEIARDGWKDGIFRRGKLMFILLPCSGLGVALDQVVSSDGGELSYRDVVVAPGGLGLLRRPVD